MKILVKISLLFWCGFTAIAQNDGIPYLDFSLSNSGSSALVTWTVKAGNTCQDVQVWRGTDSLNLKEVFAYAGICGDDDSSKVYSYTDNPPVTGITYYYRIVIITDRTQVKKVLIPPSEGLSVYPNPATEKLNLVYSPQNNLLSIEIFDSKGNAVNILNKPENFTQLNVSDWPSGVYYYKAIFEERMEINQIVIK